MVPACSFYKPQGGAGLQDVGVWEILVGKAASGPQGALSSGVMVGTVEHGVGTPDTVATWRGMRATA
jgi:hypothetical protein